MAHDVLKKQVSEVTDDNKESEFCGISVYRHGARSIHVGTGGTRLGRVDNTIVRSVTRIPKIPGSSIAGHEPHGHGEGEIPQLRGPWSAGARRRRRPLWKGRLSCVHRVRFCQRHRRKRWVRGTGSIQRYACAALSRGVAIGAAVDHVSMALRQSSIAEFSELADLPEQQVVYRKADGTAAQPSLNLGWLFLPVKTDWQQLGEIAQKIEVLGIPGYIISRLGVVSDKLFTHIVNSNLEVRTSVAIDPARGAAEEGALFTYEAMPRGTVLFGELTCRNPKHFKINQDDVKAVDSPEKVRDAVTDAHSYLEHLGIGGMGSRGMGRLRVLKMKDLSGADKTGKEVS